MAEVSRILVTFDDGSSWSGSWPEFGGAIMQGVIGLMPGLVGEAVKMAPIVLIARDIGQHLTQAPGPDTPADPDPAQPPDPPAEPG